MRLLLPLGLLVACQLTTKARVPHVASVTPASVCAVDGARVVIAGERFDPLIEGAGTTAPSVTVPEARLSGATEVALADEHWTSATQLEAVVPAGTPPGSYTLTVDNPLGGAADTTVAFEVLAPDGGPSVTEVSPRVAYKEEETRVAIAGSGFSLGASVTLVASDGTRTQLAQVVFSSPAALEAVVPAGLATGSYTVEVASDLDTRCPGSRASGLTISAGRVPRVLFLRDDAPVATGGPGSFVACGAGLDPSTTSATLTRRSDGATIALSTNTATGCPPGLDSLLLATSSALADGVYTLSTSNTTDITARSDGPPFVVLPAAPTLSGFAPAAALLHARRGASVLSARDDTGQRFLYAIGGDAPVGDAEGLAAVTAPSTLASVEFAAARYDEVTGVTALAAFAETAPLDVPRSLAAAVAVEGVDRSALYVFGGGPTSVARAALLSPRQVRPLSLSAGSGALPAGPYVYVVAAVMGPTDADNPDGESLPSPRGAIFLPQESAVTVKFAAVPGAARYRIYRTPPLPASGAGTKGEERDIADVLASEACQGTICSFDDDGLESGTRAPLAPGTLGRWQVVSTPGVAFAHGARAELLRTGGSRLGWLYVTGGTTNGTSGTDQIARFGVRNDTTLEPVDLGQSLPGPVFLHGSTILRLPGAPPRLTAVLGRPSAAYFHAAIDVVTGALGAFSTDASPTLPALSGGAALSRGSRLFWLGGKTTGGPPLADVRRSNLDATGHLVGLAVTGALNTTRFSFGAAEIDGSVFVAGGYGCDGALCAPLTSIERATYGP